MYREMKSRNQMARANINEYLTRFYGQKNELKQK